MGTGEFSAALSSLLPAFEESKLSEVFANERPADHDENTFADSKNCSVVLAGLHACGDLSATMLRLVFRIISSLVILRLIRNK